MATGSERYAKSNAKVKAAIKESVAAGYRKPTKAQSRAPRRTP